MIKKYLPERIEILEFLTLEAQKLTEYLFETHTFDENVKEFGKFMTLLESKLKSKNKKFAGIYYHVLAFIVFSELQCKELSMDILRKQLEYMIKTWKKWKSQLLHDKSLDIRHRTLLVYFFYTLILPLAEKLNISIPEMRDVIRSAYNDLMSILVWLRAQTEARRDYIDMLYVSIAIVMKALTLYMGKEKKYAAGLTDLIVDVTKSRMNRFWELNSYHYIHYYMGLLHALVNLTSFLPSGKERNKILLMLGELMEIGFVKVQKYPAFISVFGPLVVETYSLAGQEGIEKKKEFLEKYGQKIPGLLV